MAVKITQPARNLREELNELRTPTGIAGEAMMRADTPQEQFNLIGAGRKNLIINGDFRVSQRGDYSSATALGGGQYSVDRWTNYLLTVTQTVQNGSAIINGATRRTLKVTATSSGNGYISAVQKVETVNIPIGKPLTFSAWVRTNHPKVKLRQDFIGGVTSENDNFVTPDGNWHYHTWTIDTTGTTASIVVVQVIAFDYGSVSITSGDYIEVADVQLEVGKVATPFEHRSYGEELALCQRYFQSAQDSLWGWTFQGYTDRLMCIVPSIVSMRAIPTFSSSGLMKIDLPGVSNATQSSFAVSTGTSFPGQNAHIVEFLNFSGLTTSANYRIRSDSAILFMDAEL